MASSRFRFFPRTLSALGFALALGGCSVTVPIIPELNPQPKDPPKSVADFYVLDHVSGPEGEVLMNDLCAAHGLTVQVDKITAHRFLTDSTGNRVVVAPGTHEVTINGIAYPLRGEIRWRDGKIVLPGEARVVFGEHLRHEGVPDLDGVSLDGIDEARYLDQFRTGAAPKPATVRGAHMAGIKFDPNAPPLPASWNQSAHRQWEWIVVHHSATPEGGAASFNRSHKKKWENGLGYHFVVGNGTETKDGEVEVGSRWLRQNQGIDGAHAGVEKYNKHGIGVCLVGDFDHHQPSPRQLAALRNLCQHLMQRYGIAKDHIIPHHAVKSGHTECPGKSFPLDEFLRSF